MNTSKLNVISSEGYKAFLPQGRRYILVHNYSDVSVEIIKEFGKKTQNTPLRLSYIGLIRFQEQNKKIIDLFANDKRFLLQFIGKNAMELEEYVTTHHIENVRLIDQFPSDKTMDFYRNTDVILNAYGNHTPLLDYALSNKLYYAAALRLPILVSKDTYMEKIAVEGGFGFTLDIDDISIKEKFISWINGLDRIEFEKV